MVKEEKDEIELSERHKRFCESYFKDFNGSRAYKEVYEDVTDETARVNASRLLTNANINAYLESLKTKLAELSGISPLTVLNEYKKIAFSSIAHMHNAWISLKDFELLTDEQRESIQEIDTKVLKKNIGTRDEPEIVDVEYIRIKLYDKLKGLDGINKMLGYNAPEKVDHTSKGKEISISPIEWVKNGQNTDK